MPLVFNSETMARFWVDTCLGVEGFDLERTEEDQARLAKVVDGLEAGKLMKVMTDTVGVKRVAELLGWAVLWGLQGETSGVALRNKLKEKGMAQRSAYRAVEDFRLIGNALLDLPEYAGKDGVLWSLRRLAAAMA